ncbi:MAG: hypothetical protein QOF83_4262 [Solirubrobacteraceae bacterium]|jgi:hypothetical protein|nr:hypothetical protein [Solirubrobacteraceae bacterium]
MPLRLLIFPGALAALIAVLVSGCGGSSARPPGRSAAVASSPVSTPQAPAAKLRILSPHNGARTGPTVLVRIRVIGGGSPGVRAFLYRLDRRRGQRGGERLTLHHLAPGRHHLLIRFDNGAHATAMLTFVVRSSAPRPTPAAATPPASSTPAATTTGAAPAGTTAATPAPATSTPTAPATSTPSAPATNTPTAPAPTTSSPAASSIPQNNGGDRDADNNGGPTDGDGNI